MKVLLFLLKIFGLIFNVIGWMIYLAIILYAFDLDSIKRLIERIRYGAPLDPLS